MARWLFAAALLGLVLTPFTPAQDEKPKKQPPEKTVPGKKDTAPEKAGDNKDAPKADAALVAHVKLSGSLDESPPQEALFGPPPENLKSKLDRIRKAATDKKVKALYLELGGLSVGFGKLNELAAAIAEVKAAGKKVFAYSQDPGTKEYLLGLSADVFCVPEGATVSLVGLRAEVTLYKNTLALLRLEADVLKVGAYKGAVEPFTRDSLSKENREQIESLLDDNFEKEIVERMVRARPARKWTAGQVREVIDNGPYTAKKAAALGMVDRVAYQDVFEAGFAKDLGVPAASVEKNYGREKGQELDAGNPFALFAALAGPKKKRESKKDKIAVIYAVGGIETGKGGGNPLMGGESVGSDTMVAAIREAEKNPTVKAIVLRIDSPGGSALASDLIWHAVVSCKKPVIASMGDVAASGGYYIAMGCGQIYAEPGTVTGSIGVFGLKLVTGGLEQWAGMKTEVVARGKNSGVMSTTFKWTDGERKAMEETITGIYDVFIDKALAGRTKAGQKLTRDQLLALAGGRVWTGRQAKANGLVDELGTLDDAIAAAKKKAGLGADAETELLILPHPVSFLDKLMEGEAGFPFGSITAAQLKQIPGADKALKMAAPLLRTTNDPAKVMLPYGIEWK